jgi:hypothetical protein
MVSKKTIGILAGLGIGAGLLYLLSKKVSGSGGTGETGGTSTGLTIKNYSVTYDCNIFKIVASGQLVDNNGPVANNLGKIGFCSAYNSDSNDFTEGNYWTITTDQNGYFKTNIATSTPAGGQNCIIVRFTEGNDIATAKASVTIPGCAGNPIGPRPR